MRPSLAGSDALNDTVVPRSNRRRRRLRIRRRHPCENGQAVPMVNGSEAIAFVRIPACEQRTAIAGGHVLWFAARPARAYWLKLEHTNLQDPWGRELHAMLSQGWKKMLEESIVRAMEKLGDGGAK